MSDDTTFEGDYHDLPFGEQFLLWAMRQWVRGYQTSDRTQETLQKGFSLAGIGDGYLELDELMTVISYSATARIEVGCPYCKNISTDEQIFIGLFAALQRSEVAACRAFLSHWLPAAGIRLAQSPATRLAWRMARGGLTLRARVIAPSGKDQVGVTVTPQGDDQVAPVTLH